MQALVNTHSRPPRGLFGSTRPARMAAMQEAAPDDDLKNNQNISNGGGSILPAPAGGLQTPAQRIGAMAAPTVLNGDDVAKGSQALGGSMRQPFDYEAAREALQGDQRKISPWAYALAIVGDTLARQGGSQPYAVQNLMGMKQAQADRRLAAAEQIAKWQYGDYARQSEADLKAANPFTIGRNRLQYDPTSGEVATLYDGAEDAEIYADALGYDRNSPDWTRAYEDFVLRGSGPSAHSRDIELDDHRTGNDRSLEGYRQENRVSLEGIRQRNRSSMEGQRQSNRMTLRQTPPAPRASGTRPDTSIVEVSSPEEARKLPKGTVFRNSAGRVMVR